MTYTVVYESMTNNLPLRIFDDATAAQEYATEILDHQHDDDEPDMHEDVAAAHALMGAPVSEFVCVAIAHHDLEGKLVEWDVLADEDEDDDGDGEDTVLTQPAAA